MIYHCSITSRTGYQSKTRNARIVDSLAILMSMAGVGVLICGLAFASRFMA